MSEQMKIECVLLAWANSPQVAQVPEWFEPIDHRLNSEQLPNPSDFFDNDSDIQLAREWMRDPCYDLVCPSPRSEEFQQLCNEAWNKHAERVREQTYARIGRWLAYSTQLVIRGASEIITEEAG